MAEVLRQLGCTYKRIVAIVDHDHLASLEDAWKHLPRDIQPLESLIKVSDKFHGDKAPEPGDSGLDRALKQDTFLEFVEKLVIFDVLFEPFIEDHFVKLKSFPFSHEGFLGHETAVLNVFTFWQHYRSKYAQELAKVMASSAEFDQYQKDMGLKFDDDVASATDSEEMLEDELGLGRR